MIQWKTCSLIISTSEKRFFIHIIMTNSECKDILTHDDMFSVPSSWVRASWVWIIFRETGKDTTVQVNLGVLICVGWVYLFAELYKPRTSQRDLWSTLCETWCLNQPQVFWKIIWNLGKILLRIIFVFIKKYWFGWGV